MSQPRPHAVMLTPISQPLRGRLALPGSKSITNRALLLAALAKGTSRLTGALKSDDTARMAEALTAMGVGVAEPDATSFVVTASGRLVVPAAPLFLGNAGTATRFLTAAVVLVDGPVVVDGDANMRKRPIRPLVTALAELGVRAEAATGCPPVTVHGRGIISGSRVSIDAGLSSQYVSALLMLAACGQGPIEVALTGDHIGARGYIDLTVAAMQAFGARVGQPSAGLWRVAATGYHAHDMAIEPDASAATYLWAAERISGGAIDLGTPASAFTQPDAKAHAMISAWPQMAPVIEGSQMQDAIPTLAVIAAFNATPVRFTGIANLRVKECDRIRALSGGLNRIKPGLAHEDGDDLVISPDRSLIGQVHPAEIETFDDHRIAMSFALAGLLVGGITILDPACVAKTYPAYWDDLASLGVQMHISG
ncbi:MAG: 3-phosphoshikimate 1-carboxyvinyltransferase [Bosea sp. (in: a-proteobacteria)]